MKCDTSVVQQVKTETALVSMQTRTLAARATHTEREGYTMQHPSRGSTIRLSTPRGRGARAPQGLAADGSGGLTAAPDRGGLEPPGFDAWPHFRKGCFSASFGRMRFSGSSTNIFSNRSANAWVGNEAGVNDSLLRPTAGPEVGLRPAAAPPATAYSNWKLQAHNPTCLELPCSAAWQQVPQ